MRRPLLRIAVAAVVVIGGYQVSAQQPAPPEHSPDVNSRGQRRVSPRRIAENAVDGVYLAIEWGSPSKRNRVIWGSLVPYGRWWMPGADETTTITSHGALTVGDLHVPAGVHSIYTQPGEQEFMLIINRGTDLFHTEYPARLDVGRVPMTMVKLPEVVEQLTFAVDAKPDGGGTLKMSWDDREYSVALAAAGKPPADSTQGPR
jgi:hypothetical protein